MNKSKIRKRILKIRKQNFQKKIPTCFEKILKIIKKHNIKKTTIGGYYPYNYEIDIIDVLQKFEKKKYLISLPKIKNNFKMDFFKWSFNDPLKINKYGIPEPISNNSLLPDIILVPLVGFDKYLNRIGYGGGFYDRYLRKIKKNKIIITIGLAHSFQKVKKIKTNKFDMKLDFIITEKKIYQ